MTINSNWHTVFTFEDGIKVTFGSSVSREWMQFASRIVADEEQKRSKGSRKK